MINEIDPKIYNFKNLKLEDQLVVASQFKIFLLIRKEKENFNTQDLLQDLMNAGGCDADDEYSKGWDEAMEEAFNIVCFHLNKINEKVKDNACKIL